MPFCTCHCTGGDKSESDEDDQNEEQKSEKAKETFKIFCDKKVLDRKIEEKPDKSNEPVKTQISII